jgi:squalene cyclase
VHTCSFSNQETEAGSKIEHPSLRSDLAIEQDPFSKKKQNNNCINVCVYVWGGKKEKEGGGREKERERNTNEEGLGSVVQFRKKLPPRHRGMVLPNRVKRL